MLEKIFDNGYIRAVHYTPKENKQKNKIVITFQTIAGSLSNSGFGTSFFEKRGIEYIFISHKGRSFYQKLSASDFYLIVRDYIVGKDVFLYGSSLGGYAAVYYSGVVNGQAIALSPRCTADPIYGSKREDVVFNHTPISELEEDLISDFDPIIAYDSSVLKDKIFMTSRILKCYEKSKILNVPNGMHPVGALMNNSGMLKDFIIGAIEKRDIVITKDFDPLTSPTYTFNIARECLAKNDTEGFNKNLYFCLKWGGHKRLVPLIRKAIHKNMLMFRIDSKDIPQSAKTFHANREKLDLNLYNSNDIIRIMMDNLDYSSALILINLKTKSALGEEIYSIKKDVIKEKSFIEKLPSFDEYSSSINVS